MCKLVYTVSIYQVRGRYNNTVTRPGWGISRFQDRQNCISQGEKWNFPSVLWKWNLTFHWPSYTNPVEDRAKCRMCMTFGSILYRIGGKRSMISCPQDRWEISFFALWYMYSTVLLWCHDWPLTLWLCCTITYQYWPIALWYWHWPIVQLHLSLHHPYWTGACGCKNTCIAS